MLLLCYNLLLPLALIISFPFYLRRMLKRGGYGKNFLQRFGIYAPDLKARLSHYDWTWVRAVSVGEIMLALRLVEEMKRQSPDFRAVISTTTSTGYALARQRIGTRDWLEIVYSPIDLYPIVSACWKKMHPTQAILIDSDLWPSFLAVAEAIVVRSTLPTPASLFAQKSVTQNCDRSAKPFSGGVCRHSLRRINPMPNAGRASASPLIESSWPGA
jgi:3-deoxy-D-manno-octulosonic-acid transferase